MTYQYEEIKKTTRQIETEPFYKNLVKVHDTITTTDVNNSNSKTITTTFITSIENVEKVKGLEPIRESIYMSHLYNEQSKVHMLSKENYKKLLDGLVHISESGIIEEYDDKIYNEDTYMIVLFNWGSHELTDLDGNYIPIAVHVSYEYYNGRMTNTNYDLPAIVQLLKNNDSIIAYDSKPYSHSYAKRCELKITDIPYYNADVNTYEQLDFYFVPTADIYNEAMRLKNSYERIPYMLEKMFGITRKEYN